MGIFLIRLKYNFIDNISGDGHLLLGRKTMKILGSILKSIDINLSTKIHIVKAIIFPVVMYRCESWNIKKDEC